MSLAFTPPAPTLRPRLGISLIGTLARWNAARLTRRALRRMSRHELGDIGIDDLELLTR